MSVAYAASGGGAGATILNLLPLIIIFVVFYLLLILPQQRRAKAQRERLGRLQVGDRVLTNGGLVGIIVKLTSPTYLEVAFTLNSTTFVRRSAVVEINPDLTGTVVPPKPSLFGASKAHPPVEIPQQPSLSKEFDRNSSSSSEPRRRPPERGREQRRREGGGSGRR